MALSKNRQYTAQDLKHALSLVENEHKSLYAASRVTGVPWSTLKGYVNREDKSLAKLGRPFALTADLEMAPMTNAERQRKCREKLKQNWEKFEEKRRRHREYMRSVRKPKRKHAADQQAADSKRKKFMETEIKEENTQIDYNTDLILAEEFVADIDTERTNDSTDPIKTEELQEFEQTRCLENSQNQTNRKRILLKGFETDDTELQHKTEMRKTEDPDLSFFHSLLPDMNEMSLDQKRRFKIGVLQLACDILQEK